MKWGFRNREEESGSITGSSTRQDYYEDPCDVALGPKGHGKGEWCFELVKILHNSGPGGFSVAVGRCDSISSQACGRMIAMRWNGADNNNNDTGFPKSAAGGPDWFPIPREYFALIVKTTEELSQADRIIEQAEDYCQK